MNKVKINRPNDGVGVYLQQLIDIKNSLPLEQQELMAEALVGLDQTIRTGLPSIQVQPDYDRYRGLFENSHTIMLLIDPKTGTIEDVNPAAVSFYGYKKEEFLKLNISEINLLPPAEIMKNMELARTHKQKSFDFKHRLANGEIRDVVVDSGPIKLTGREWLYSIIQDNTERKRTEESLDRERRLLRTVIDNLPDQIFAHDRQGRFILNNLSDARVMGVSDPEKLLGKGDRDFYPPELAAAYFADDLRVIESDQVVVVEEEPSVTANAKQRWVNTTKVPLHDSQGQVIGLIGIARDITEHKKMEASLRENEEKYRNLFEEAIEGIVQSTPEGKYLNVNHSFVKMFGYDSAEEMIETVSDIGNQIYADPADRNRLLSLLANNDRVEDFESQGTRKDGQKIWLSLNVIAIRNQNGQIVRFDSRVVDVTKRKQAEVSLEQKTEELDRFFTIGLDLLCIADDEGFIRRLNLAWENTLGFSLPELTDTRFLDYVHPDDMESTTKSLDELSTQKRMINFVNRFRCKDGSYRWIEWHSAPYGNLIYAAARDITNRKQSEDDLYNSQRMLQLVLESIPQRVFWKDRNLAYLGCNRSLAIDAGLKASADIIGKKDLDLRWKLNASLYQDDDQWVMENNTPKLNFEEPQTQVDGSQSWLRTNKVPLHDRDGRVIGVLGTYEDVTDRKRAEEQVKETNEKLTRLVNSLEQRNMESNLLRQMDDLLQVCNVSDEANTVIQQFGPKLFPGTSGALYLMSNSRRTVEAVAVWGDNLESERIFAPDDCWTLRRGQYHQWSMGTAGLRCRHIPRSFTGEYLGVPMLAAGELLGLLHIEGPAVNWCSQDLEELSRSVSEHLALSLSNIKLREKLRAQSIRDSLTGLFNRRYMEESLELELRRATRNHSTVGIIMIDIDHFKDFNDTYGHEAGDAVLHELGALLQSQIRGGDIACRFGGEEFILILPEASVEITQQRADHIRSVVKGMTVEFHYQSLGVITISLGISMFPLHSSNSEGLLHKADKALYKAKHNGRDRVEVSDDIP